MRSEHQGGQRHPSPDKQRATDRYSAAWAYALLLRLYPRARRRASVADVANLPGPLS